MYQFKLPRTFGSLMAKSNKSNRPQQRKTLTEQAYETLRRAIIQGDFEEGSFLSVPDVMKKYGIGRTPFREACNRLHHEKILEVVSRRGYLVQTIARVAMDKTGGVIRRSSPPLSLLQTSSPSGKSHTSFGTAAAACRRLQRCGAGRCRRWCPISFPGKARKLRCRIPRPGTSSRSTTGTTNFSVPTAIPP